MLRTLLTEEARLLTFRPVSSAIHVHWMRFLAFGLLFTWLAGVGRYWDNPKAAVWQTLGLGSVAYVFILSFIIWIIIAPLRPKNWSYRNVLLFITLTAPPAVLYAIPVERFVTAQNARAANAWFLAIVASWRVGLLSVFLRRAAGLSIGMVVVATLTPLAIIVIALAILNLEHVVFDLMAGAREESSNDAAYMVVFWLSLLAFFTAPFLFTAYCVASYRAWRGVKQALPAERTSLH